MLSEVESGHRERTTVLSDSVSVTCSASWSTLCILATSPALNCTPLDLQRCSRSSLNRLLHTLHSEKLSLPNLPKPIRSGASNSRLAYIHVCAQERRQSWLSSKADRAERMIVPAVASANTYFLVLPKIAHGIVPLDVQCALKTQFPEFVFPHAIVVDKRNIMACNTSLSQPVL